jgi:hypothetical protein
LELEVLCPTIPIVIYQQAEGGSIGLELTIAESRPFLFRWDRIYLDNVKKNGVKMAVYERYVDESNQIANLPPPVPDLADTRNVIRGWLIC